MKIIMKDVITGTADSQEAAYTKLKNKLNILYEDFRKGAISVRYDPEINQWCAQCVVAKYEE